MLAVLLDMGVLWILLAVFSDEDWNDRKLTIFFISCAISFLGLLAAYFAGMVGGIILGLGTYYAVGTICLYALGSIPFQKSLGAMAIFLGYKILLTLVFQAAGG